MSSQTSLVYTFLLLYLLPSSFVCSRNDPPSFCHAAAVSHLLTLPHSDIIAWTDGLVPGGLGEGEAGIHIECTKCFTAASLFLAGRCATSYTAETYAILHALEWCISHSSSCNFEFVILFSDSQSVLIALSTPLPYPTVFSRLLTACNKC